MSHAALASRRRRVLSGSLPAGFPQRGDFGVGVGQAELQLDHAEPASSQCLQPGRGGVFERAGSGIDGDRRRSRR